MHRAISSFSDCCYSFRFGFPYVDSALWLSCVNRIHKSKLLLRCGHYSVDLCVRVRALMRTNFSVARHRLRCSVRTNVGERWSHTTRANSYRHPQYIFHILSILSHVFFSSSDSFDFLCTTRLKSSNQIHFVQKTLMLLLVARMRLKKREQLSVACVCAR